MIDLELTMRNCASLPSPGGEIVLAICAELSSTRASLAEAMDALEEVTLQATAVGRGQYDNMTLRCYADALRLLAGDGRVRIITDEGRRVIAEVIPREERK
jgi:hypothetical protein